MESFVRSVRYYCPQLDPELGFQLFLLQAQYRTYFLGDRTSDSIDEFNGFWEREPEKGELPIELEISSLLSNENWIGKEKLQKKIYKILDETMLVDEIEELRVLFLQNVFYENTAGILDVRAAVANQPEWSWALNPTWHQSADREEIHRLLLLKYDYFSRLGWLKDKSPQNPVIAFQLEFVSNSELDIRQLIEMDTRISQGSEIFLRLRNVNPFLISFIYSLFRSEQFSTLAKLEVTAA